MKALAEKIPSRISNDGIFVTKDYEETSDIAVRVVVINNGKIDQIGTKQEMAE
ncbi:hypothetical protein WAX46_04205 [Bacillus sp. FJAT-53060]|uniref:hypothetical protein n=1 Tax=Bacillus TaxID=1386 RepID=UPI001CFA55CD|nr:hypothetical protein [Bacillus stratosphericus]